MPRHPHDPVAARLVDPRLTASLRRYLGSRGIPAPSIIESAGLGLRKAPVHAPRVFAAKAGAVSGSAKLIAPTAGARAAYLWQYSSDAGKTWLDVSPTLQAKTTVTGLPSGTTVQFRFRSMRSEPPPSAACFFAASGAPGYCGVNRSE